MLAKDGFLWQGIVMNKLPLAKRTQILAMLCEGSSMRSISRVADVSINTVSKLLVEAGEACLAFHDRVVRGVKSERIQCDEIWSFCYSKQKNVGGTKGAPLGAGDVWTWTAIDPDTKLIVSFYVGDRSQDTAMEFAADLRARVDTRVQLSTDGHGGYLPAIEAAFGSDVDYGQVVKHYAQTTVKPGRYSPAKFVSAKKFTVEGNPDKAHISTSIVERQNLNMRMGMRRFTRLTNAFSKKWENHVHALSLYFVFYNFCRIHKTLRTTPAMAAGITENLFSLDDIVAWIDENAPAPKVRGPYKKRAK
jgi:IS1 family transposase